jgi:hypothetical protein
MKYLILFLLLSNISFAGPAGTKGEDGNFKVSEKSLNHLGVKFQPLLGNGPWIVPADALVKIKLTLGVYRRYEGEITYVIVKKLADHKGTVTIQAEDLEAGDEVAISGTKFLRMTETDLNSETVDNCAH